MVRKAQLLWQMWQLFLVNLNRIEIVFRFEDEIRRIMQNAEEMKPQE